MSHRHTAVRVLTRGEGGRPRWIVRLGVGAGLVVVMGAAASPAVAAEPPVTAGTITVGDNPWDVAITPDGRTGYVTVSGEDALDVIDVGTSAVVGSIPVGRDPQGVEIAPNGLVYVANFVDGTVSAVDPAAGAAVATIPVGFHPQGVAASGDRVLVTNYGVQDSPDPGSVSVIDTATNSVVGEPIGVGANPAQIAVSPDSSTAYVTNRVDGTISVIDLADLAVTATVPVGAQPWGIVFSPSGGTAYVALAGDNAVAVLTTATLTVADLIDVGPGLQPWGLALSADASLLFVANSASESLGTVDLSTQTLLFDSDTDIDGWNIAADSSGCIALVTNFAQNTVTVMDVSEPIALPDSPALLAQVGRQYDHQIGVSPAGAKTSFEIVSGRLPAGLSLDAASGRITGIPTEPGDFAFGIGATSCDKTARSDFTLSVDPGSPAIDTSRPKLAETGSTSSDPLLTAAGLVAVGSVLAVLARTRGVTRTSRAPGGGGAGRSRRRECDDR